MGKIRNRVACYYWYCTKTERRVSWFFGSRKNAERWKKGETWRYQDFPLLEVYLRGHSGSRRTKETELWRIHRDKYNNWEMRMARVIVDE